MTRTPVTPWTRPLAVVAGLAMVASVSAGLEAPTAHATAAACHPATAGTGAEAAIDSHLFAAATGTLEAVMLFVDFPNAPSGADSTTDLHDVLAEGADWLASSADGQFHLNITPVHDQWFEMPEHDNAYGTFDTFEAHRRYVADAVEAADDDVDFAGYDVVYVVPSTSADAFRISPAGIAGPSQGITVDGNELRHWVTFGQDMHDWGFKVLPHETGHLLGLPDLYRYDAPGDFEATHGHAGGWDVMGFISGHSPDLLGWHKHLLGWLAPDDVACVTAAGATDVELQPLAASSGTRLAVVPVGGDDVLYGIEYRDGTGLDTPTCDTGVLIYRIDQHALEAPVTVVDAAPTTRPVGEGCQFDLDDAAFGASEVFMGPGITVEVVSLGGTANVRVSRDAAADPIPGVVRVAGTDRYVTAADVARRGFDPALVGTVFLATGTDFPDALAGGPLAAQLGGPILLAASTGLPDATREALADLQPETVVALGGTAVLSDDILAAAGSAAGGATTARRAATTGCEPAAARAPRLAPSDKVYLAVGSDFPDALAGSAATDGSPILLVSNGALPAATAAALRQRAPTQVIALGGRAVIPDAVLAAAAAEAGGAGKARLAGTNRYETAVKIADTIPAPSSVTIAVGTNFPDALAGGPAAAAAGGPILLTASDALPGVVAAWLRDLPDLQRVVILGGTNAISDAVQAELAALAG